jgi:MerR family transcriptional regulator, thiopeptide resistance regulator
MTETPRAPGAPYTVGRLAKRFGLSRTALLHYDAVGVLSPSGRTGANYRVYTEADAERLARICSFREAGLSLEQIRNALGAKRDTVAGILAARLEQIGAEMSRLRGQQRILARMLGEGAAAARAPVIDKARWIEILRASGMSDDEMARWHVEFERLAPAAHAEFLVSLGIPQDEIEGIRRRSRGRRSVSAKGRA